MNRRPLAWLQTLRLDPPSPSDKTADRDRLRRALLQAGYPRVSFPLSVMRRLPDEMRRRDFELTAVLGQAEDEVRVIDIGREKVHGIALDIGSTNIEASLFDLSTGDRLDQGGRENPQLPFGADVLTRVQRSMMGGTEELVRVLRTGVNGLIDTLCSRNHFAADDIVAVAVAGNTIMSHFFLGLSVDNIPVAPYVPAVNGPVFTTGREAGLSVNEGALVYVFPNAGSYVGGDIISGILHAGVHREEEPVLFIDVGTNVEITLGCRDWIMTGAGAAGPALEGGVAGIGKKAEPGTISGVRIGRSNRGIDLDVMDNREPTGICGSGLIDLVSEMFSAGLIDQSGKFTGIGEGFRERDGERLYAIYGNGNDGLSISEAEIRNFLFSKAAMFSFLYVFVKSVGLTFRDIKKVYVAGALGCGIDPESAVNIGMLPDIPRDRFIPIGNSSLSGAEMLLLDRGLLDEAARVAALITYREMNEDAELMSVLQGALFIPHTQPELLKGA